MFVISFSKFRKDTPLVKAASGHINSYATPKTAAAVKKSHKQNKKKVFAYNCCFFLVCVFINTYYRDIITVRA